MYESPVSDDPGPRLSRKRFVTRSTEYGAQSAAAISRDATEPYSWSVWKNRHTATAALLEAVSLPQPNRPDCYGVCSAARHCLPASITFRHAAALTASEACLLLYEACLLTSLSLDDEGLHPHDARLIVNTHLRAREVPCEMASRHLERYGVRSRILRDVISRIICAAGGEVF